MNDTNDKARVPTPRPRSLIPNDFINRPFLTQFLPGRHISAFSDVLERVIASLDNVYIANRYIEYIAGENGP